MLYRELAPPPDLADRVRCLWHLHDPGASAADAPEPVLPDGFPELVLNLGAPMVHHPPGGSPEPQPRALVAGVITRPFHLSSQGPIDLVGVRFHPAGARFLYDGPMDALVDRWDTPRDFSWWESRVGRLGGASGPDRPERVWQALRRQLERGPAVPNDAVVRAAARIVSSHGAATVDELARAVGLGPRQLSRRFRDEVGVGPKLLGRIVRFQRALTLMTGPAALPAARAAVAAGYSDQAHMIGDVSDFTHMTPGQLLAVARPLADLFTGAELA